MDTEPLRIALVAGEPSGDRQGAALLRAVRAQAAPRPVEAWGIGGALMAEAGVRLLHNSEQWASIGIAEALRHIPSLLRASAQIKQALRRDPPDVLVVIDAGAVNVPLARWAKTNHVCPVFYYFPPGSWRRQAIARSGKKSLGAATDRIVTPFPWSEALLRSEGADTHFVGHPLLDLVRPTLTDTEFYERFGLDPHRPLIALLPGSRPSEIRHILPPLVGAANEIARRTSGAQFVVALASEPGRSQAEKLIRREQRRGGAKIADKIAQIAHDALPVSMPRLVTSEGLTLEGVPAPPPVRSLSAGGENRPAPLVICAGLTWDVLARCDLALTKSGTATLEAMILKKPMIIVYRGSALAALEWRLRRRSLNLTHIGMPNLLAGERLFAELLQDEATPEAIADLAVDLLLDPVRILALKERLGEMVQHTLGEPGGVARAAALLLDLAQRKKDAS